MTTKEIGIGKANNGSLIYGEGGIRSGSPILGDTTLSSIPFKMAKSSIKNITGELGTFTRATSATVIDHEGVVREVNSGEVRFQGQRRVENLNAGSEDISSATMLNMTADDSETLRVTTASVTSRATVPIIGLTIGQKIVFSVELEDVSMTQNPYIWIAKAGGGDDGIKVECDISSGIKRFTTSHTTLVAGDYNCHLYLSPVGGGNSTVSDELKARYWMNQDKTGASDPTVPDGYVSTGILSAPYHGAGVDGVACFKSTNGNSVTSNIVTHAAGTLITNDIGYFGELARTNKCTNYNANPASGAFAPTTAATFNTNTTNLVASGGDGSTLWGVVDDATELAAAGLEALCTSNLVYKIDNSAGAAVAYINSNGAAANTNNHTITAWIRNTGGTARLRLDNATDIGDLLAIDSSYRKVTTDCVTVVATDLLKIQANVGAVVYFILNQLEEGAFSTSEIITEGSAVTRNKDELSYPTTYIPVNDFAVTFEWTPTAAGQSVAVLFGIYVDANNWLDIYASATTITVRKRISGTTNQFSISYAHLANTLVDMKLRLDSSLGVDMWANGSKGVGHSNVADLPSNTTIEIGALNSTNHQTGGIKNFTLQKGKFTDTDMDAL